VPALSRAVDQSAAGANSSEFIERCLPFTVRNPACY
jgi:hypothetical protein